MVGQASFVSEKLLCFAFALVAQTTPPAPSQWNGKPGTNHHRAASQRAPLGTLGTYLSKHPPVWKQKPQVPRPDQVLHSGGSKRTATRGASFSTHGPTMHVYFRTSIFSKISISCSFINNFFLSSLPPSPTQTCQKAQIELWLCYAKWRRPLRLAKLLAIPRKHSLFAMLSTRVQPPVHWVSFSLFSLHLIA